MNLQDIRNLIAQGDTEGAIKALLNRVQEGAGHNKRLRDDLLILSNRFEALKHKETIGVLEQSDVVREHAQVNEALLNLMGEIETGRPAKEIHKNELERPSERGSNRLRLALRVFAVVLAVSASGFFLWKMLRSGELPAPLKPETGQSRPNPEMVFLEGGLFEMGSAAGERDENPHAVTVNSFYIDKHEVTNAEYAAYLNAAQPGDPKASIDLEKTYGNERCRIFKSSGVYQVESGYEKHPVNCVSWAGAMAFARYYGMRLPTEAEWEYAARGGKTGLPNQNKFSGGNDIETVAWYNRNSGMRIRPVALKKPNEAGIYDMSGNLYEWCSDYYDAKYYFYSPRENPQGPDSSKVRVVRGGNVFLADSLCRTANRGQWPGLDFNVGIGFRCVREK